MWTDSYNKLHMARALKKYIFIATAPKGYYNIICEICPHDTDNCLMKLHRF